jgi:hypothetical protein
MLKNYKLNVLILHRMGDPMYYRESVKSLEYMVPQCRSDINCIVHDCDLKFPEYLKDVDYHLIILGPTFLCARYVQKKFDSILKKYNFIKDSPACKIALPQDDYDCSGILDDWMVAWKIDRIYTIVSNHWNVIYPKSTKYSQLKQGYTAYIADDWIKYWINPKPHCKRKIDVSYRASKLDENFGSLGQLKWQIAEKFKESVPLNFGLCIDISTNSKDTITGKKWHNFIENSKFCLAVPSGSSLLDPDNKIRNCINKYKALNKNLLFRQIEKNCFPQQDNKFIFSMISPRNIEAALAETVQIAVIGNYSGLMKPMDHYIPLEKNCNNIKEVISMMKDNILIKKIKKNCKDSILSEPRLRQKIIVDEIIEFAESIVTRRNLVIPNQEKINNQFSKYRFEIEKISNKFWNMHRKINKLKNIKLINKIFNLKKKFYYFISNTRGTRFNNL